MRDLPNNVLVIDDNNINENTIKDCINNGIDVIIVNNDIVELQNTFILNDVVYTPIVKKQNKYNRNTAGSSKVMDDMFSMSDRYERKLAANTDIIKEYGLIQLKQSKLSKWERNQVIHIFEMNFKQFNIK